jgi:hypothetical protein
MFSERQLSAQRVLDFLPEIRWADLPVSLLSFERGV